MNNIEMKRLVRPRRAGRLGPLRTRRPANKTSNISTFSSTRSSRIESVSKKLFHAVWNAKTLEELVEIANQVSGTVPGDLTADAYAAFGRWYPIEMLTSKLLNSIRDPYNSDYEYDLILDIKERFEKPSAFLSPEIIGKGKQEPKPVLTLFLVLPAASELQGIPRHLIPDHPSLN